MRESHNHIDHHIDYHIYSDIFLSLSSPQFNIFYFHFNFLDKFDGVSVRPTSLLRHGRRGMFLHLLCFRTGGPAGMCKYLHHHDDLHFVFV